MPKPQIALPTRARLQRTLWGGLLLGPLETEIMTIIWREGTCTVREIGSRLSHKAAYTTIITTLKRLVHKKMLQRTGSKRPFFYSPQCSEMEWQQSAARAAVERLLSTPNLPLELLIAVFQEAVAKRGAKPRHDA